MEKWFDQAIKACVAGGEEIIKVYEEGFEIEYKADHSPLTTADKNANAVITRLLEEFDIPILSEEGKDIPYSERSDWKQFWLVDPLDGTKEFIKRNGEFTVNIALIEDEYPVFGVIYVPVTRELFVGGPALEGAYSTTVNGSDATLRQIKTLGHQLPNNSTEKTMVVASRSHLSEDTKQFVQELREEGHDIEFVSMGSSLKICLVASGKADYYPRFAPTMEWDTGAGQAIAEAAGCTFVDWKTQERKKYNNENLRNNWFLVKR